MENKEIGERLLMFSGELIKLLDQLPPTLAARKISDQLIRSAMSVGANYEESRGAESRADFCHKLQIALKEMRETRYWLRLVQTAGYGEAETVSALVDEATQLRSIFGKAVATARGKARDEGSQTSNQN